MTQEGSLPPARVTVVIPSYNLGRYLGETVGSLQDQTLDAWRAVIVDDVSGDDSRQVAATLAAGDARITMIGHDENRGVCATRNTGAERADTDYLLFLDSDDAVEPTLLETAVGYLDDHPEVGLVYFRHSRLGPSGEQMGVELDPWPWSRWVATRFGITTVPDDEPSTPFESIYIPAVLVPSIAVLRRTVFERAGRWDETFGSGCEDTDLFCRMALSALIHFCPQPLVRYRHHPAQAQKSVDWEAQYDKLHTKLLALGAGRTSLVGDAEWFRAHRFVPCRAFGAAAAALRQRQFRRSARFLRRAVRHYSPRRPPASLFSVHPTGR